MVKSYRYPKSSHANIDDKHDVAKYKHLNALVQFDLITIVPMITCSFTRWLSNCTIFVWNNNENKYWVNERGGSNYVNLFGWIDVKKASFKLQIERRRRNRLESEMCERVPMRQARRTWQHKKTHQLTFYLFSSKIFADTVNSWLFDKARPTKQQPKTLNI